MITWIKKLIERGADDPINEYEKQITEQARISERSKKIDDLIEQKTKELNDLIEHDEKFEIGDYVKYTKIPNDLKLGVVSYSPRSMCLGRYSDSDGDFPDVYLYEPVIAAQYIYNGEIKQIKDAAKWFVKVEKEEK